MTSAKEESSKGTKSTAYHGHFVTQVKLNRDEVLDANEFDVLTESAKALVRNDNMKLLNSVNKKEGSIEKG